jgi:hypothetical protein
MSVDAILIVENSRQISLEQFQRGIKMDFSGYVQFCIVTNILKQFCRSASEKAPFCQNKKAGICGKRYRRMINFHPSLRLARMLGL